MKSLAWVAFLVACSNSNQKPPAPAPAPAPKVTDAPKPAVAPASPEFVAISPAEAAGVESLAWHGVTFDLVKTDVASFVKVKGAVIAQLPTHENVSLELIGANLVFGAARVLPRTGDGTFEIAYDLSLIEWDDKAHAPKATKSWQCVGDDKACVLPVWAMRSLTETAAVEHTKTWLDAIASGDHAKLEQITYHPFLFAAKVKGDSIDCGDYRTKKLNETTIVEASDCLAEQLRDQMATLRTQVKAIAKGQLLSTAKKAPKVGNTFVIVGTGELRVQVELAIVDDQPVVVSAITANERARTAED
jgi:hypothetical protein